MRLQPSGRHYLHKQWLKSRKGGCDLNQNRDSTFKNYLWLLCTADCPGLPICLIATCLKEYFVVLLLPLNHAGFSFNLINQILCCSLLPKVNTNCCPFIYPSLCPFIAAFYLFVKNVLPCLTRITLEISISCIATRS